MGFVQNIQSHTALRGIAALLVVYGHYSAVFGKKIAGWDFFVPRTHLGVDFFFLLSGFILYLVYQRDFSQTVTATAWGHFMKRRVARIYPLHLVTLFAVILLLRFHVPTKNFGILGLNLGLMQGWGFTDRFEFNSPSWSISCEFAAYLIFPFLMVLQARRFGWAVLLAGSLGIYVLLWRIGGGSLALDAIGRQHVLLRVAAAFPVGMVLAQMSRRARLEVLALAGVWQAAAFGVFAVALWQGVPDIALVPALAMILLATISQKGVVSRGLRFGPLVGLGEVSYGIYLIHWPMMMVMFNLRPKLERVFAGGMLEAVSLLVFVTLTLGLAYASYRYFERPLMRLARRDAVVLAA